MTLLHEIFSRTGRTPDEILAKSETVRLFCYRSIIETIKNDKNSDADRIKLISKIFGGKK